MRIPGRPKRLCIHDHLLVAVCFLQEPTFGEVRGNLEDVIWPLVRQRKKVVDISEIRMIALFSVCSCSLVYAHK